MKPIGFHILIDHDQANDTKIITMTDLPRPNTGTVLEVGSKVTEVNVGDHIMFKDTFSSHQVPGQEDLLVMHEDSILLILKQ